MIRHLFDPGATSGRSLTSGEIALAKTVFGAEIDYARPRIFNRRWVVFQRSSRAMAPNGNIYYPSGHERYRADLSAAGVDIHAQATFIHELAHVWQHQKGVNLIARGILERRYDYLPLTERSRFDKLGIEAQAQVIRDYFYLLNEVRDDGWPPIDVYVQVIPFLGRAAVP